PASSLRLSFLFSCSSPTPRSTLFPYTTLFRSLLRYLRYRVTRSGVCAGEGARTGVYRSGVEFIFDAQELVVLVHALAAGRGTGLDLAGVHGDGQVSNRRVLGFPTAVGDHRREARALGEADRVEGLAEGTDLVDLHEQGVGRLLLDPTGETLGVGDEQVVPHDLHLLADLGTEVAPAAPPVLAQRVL